MRSTLVKIGKAWNVLRRDGLGAGTKRILSAWSAERELMQVEPGDILFISNGIGDSARYRTRHVAEELRFQGFKASVTVQDHPDLLSLADQFKIFVFHRVLFTESVSVFVSALKQKGKTIIFEADDLVYDPEYLKYMAGYAQMNPLEKKLYENGLGREIFTDPFVKTCTTSTRYLAERMREKGKEVFVVRNKVSGEDVALAKEILQHVKRNAYVRLCYMSGTASHDRDFATIAGVLVELFQKYPKMELLIVGPLRLDEGLDAFGGQIKRLKFMPRDKMFRTLSNVDINLAPLEIGNPFCEAKSELKFFEAGLVCVPTVAAATGTFKEAIQDGNDGFVASTEAEWIEKLERLITDGDLRKRMGGLAREAVLSRYTTHVIDNSDYYNFLRGKL